MTRRWLLAAALLIALAPAAGAAAADINVISAGAYKPVLDEVVPAFEQRTGHHVTIVTDTVGGIVARMDRNEAFDLVILSQAAAAGPQRNGQIILVTPIASVGIAVAVRAGASKPDISTDAALKASLLAAPKVAMVDPASGGTSGVYLSKMFEQMGIAEQMRPKLVLTPGGLPAERVASGEAALALGQASELLAVRGVTLVGPLPAPFQQRTIYVAAMNPKAAEAPLILLAALASPQTVQVLESKGMGPP